MTSFVLVRATYRRIRIAQTVLGYSTVLPHGEDDEEDATEMQVRAWTRKEALEAILHEAKGVMEEFRDDLSGVGDDSLVLVDAEEPTSPSKW